MFLLVRILTSLHSFGSIRSIGSHLWALPTLGARVGAAMPLRRVSLLTRCDHLQVPGTFRVIWESYLIWEFAAGSCDSTSPVT